MIVRLEVIKIFFKIPIQIYSYKVAQKTHPCLATAQHPFGTYQKMFSGSLPQTYWYPPPKLCIVWLLDSLIPFLHLIPTIQNLRRVTFEFFDPSLAYDSHHPKLALYDSWVFWYLSCVSLCCNVSQNNKNQIRYLLVMGLVHPLELAPTHPCLLHKKLWNNMLCFPRALFNRIEKNWKKGEREKVKMSPPH